MWHPEPPKILGSTNNLPVHQRFSLGGVLSLSPAETKFLAILLIVSRAHLYRGMAVEW
jgi:hypothetical protein